MTVPNVLSWDTIQKKGKVYSKFILHALCRYRAYSQLPNEYTALKTSGITEENCMQSIAIDKVYLIYLHTKNKKCEQQAISNIK
jgi:hypothetical protein